MREAYSTGSFKNKFRLRANVSKAGGTVYSL